MPCRQRGSRSRGRQCAERDPRSRCPPKRGVVPPTWHSVSRRKARSSSGDRGGRTSRKVPRARDRFDADADLLKPGRNVQIPGRRRTALFYADAGHQAQVGGPPAAIAVGDRGIDRRLPVARTKGGVLLATWRRVGCCTAGNIEERSRRTLARTLAMNEDDSGLVLELPAGKSAAYVRRGVVQAHAANNTLERMERRLSPERRQGRTCCSRAYARISSALEGISWTPLPVAARFTRLRLASRHLNEPALGADDCVQAEKFVALSDRYRAGALKISSSRCSSHRHGLARPERFGLGNSCGFGGAIELVFPSEFDEFLAL